ncbi:MAG: hypothetical protein D6687_09270 [Acidobacteria bacterium]|jgi:tetrahydromethanopterin S-methyltransferase subunit B|nr:MAG: hypothetical protein D6687_09270 [Acidobacteriota bacterium]GIU82325.1 MAG: hypothetical protein KatS3mg006_1389 [Pyrinomonadaceae bacterium]
MEKFTVVCPHCESILTIDAKTGAILSHQEKEKKLSSFEELKEKMEKEKELREQIFHQELASIKERERILEEKFKEALKRAEKGNEPMKNPLDLD